MFVFEALPEDADAVLALEPDELGLRLLPTLARPIPSYGGCLSLQSLLGLAFAPEHHTDGRTGTNSAYPIERHREIKEAIAEAWAWLEGEGLIVPTLENHSGGGDDFHPRNRRVSRKGRKLAADPKPALSARLLPKATLHPLVREDVWGLFHRGKYDGAVFEAMKAVEVRVREVSRLQAKDIGTNLMRKAFDPAAGPLTDQTAELSEREARSALFAGTIGSYKNPQSHRKVALDDPDEATEIIMLANHLLRIVDAREAALDQLT